MAGAPIGKRRVGLRPPEMYVTFVRCGDLRKPPDPTNAAATNSAARHAAAPATRACTRQAPPGARIGESQQSAFCSTTGSTTTRSKTGSTTSSTDRPDDRPDDRRATATASRITTQIARNGQFRITRCHATYRIDILPALRRVRTGNPALDTDAPWRYALLEQRPRLRGASL